MRQWKPGDFVTCELNFEQQVQVDSELPDGFIKGIASTSSTDLYGHKVLAGAFDKSIRQKGFKKGPGIKLLMHHNWEKPAGVIRRLETNSDGKLEIEAELALKSDYVRDLYEVTKLNEGLNFSVGFYLEEFEFVDEEQQKKSGDDAWLVVKQAELSEVSIVCFPACVDAEMTFVKNGPVYTMADLEKALVADGLCKNRSEAHRFTLAVKPYAHLFGGPTSPGAMTVDVPQHPLLDAHQLKAAMDLTAKFKAILGAH